ncbi:5-oxoprolinase subunit PxpA [Bacillus timonensis]|nr:5-oxoprolinase subunit PxpA [Bacillus timonensis]
MRTIDVNCDMGESFGSYRVGCDTELFPYISSANIACGFHAGDPHVMNETVKQAAMHNVSIGAHPGYQDLQGFGRRLIPLSPIEVTEMILYQLGALSAFCKANSAHLSHVKPHGALYNLAATNREVAKAIATAVASFDNTLCLYGLAGSELIAAGNHMGLKTASEVFADRTYQSDGTLTPRSEKNAVIQDVNLSVKQVLQMIQQGTVTSVDGQVIPIQVDTICVHGDSTHALLFLQELHNQLTANNIVIKAKW